MKLQGENDLFELLPALYRARDAEGDRALEALFRVLSNQGRLLREDIDGLWDDFFIDTCADWVVPYIGDLVGNKPLPDNYGRRRADVANTIYYRQRKGTIVALEELAFNITGWPTHAVACFELLNWDQNLNHIRRSGAAGAGAPPGIVDRVGTVNLRNRDVLDRLDGPFDTLTHNIDVGPMEGSRGRYGIRKVAFFAYRLQAFTLERVTLRPSSSTPRGFSLHALGAPVPSFTRPLSRAESSRSCEANLPAPLRASAVVASPQDYYGAGRSVLIYDDSGAPIPVEDVEICDLSSWHQPTRRVALDPGSSRVAFRDPPSSPVRADATHGFSAPIGGGPYDRRSTDPGALGFPDTVATPTALGAYYRVAQAVSATPTPGTEPAFETLGEALDRWRDDGKPAAVIQIEDNGCYVEDAIIALLEDGVLILQSRNGNRPVISGNVSIQGAERARFELNGILVAGAVAIAGGIDLARIVDATLVPGLTLDEDSGLPVALGAPSLVITDSASADLRVDICRSITGPIRAPDGIDGLWISDSIVGTACADEGAIRLDALASGAIDVADLPQAVGTASLTIGSTNAVNIAFATPPPDIEGARNELELAIHAAAPEAPGFRDTRVIVVGDRLVIVPPRGEAITLQPGAPDDRLLRSLRFDAAGQEKVNVVRGARVAALPGSTGGDLDIVAFGEMHTIHLDAASSIADLAANLQAELRAVGLDGCRVQMASDHLLVVPPLASQALTFAPTRLASGGFDPTARDLGLVLTPPWVGPPANLRGGPNVSIERTTAFGPGDVRTLRASESIFTLPIFATHRQEGCVRFSYVPSSSRTPRRYRCQPDLAVAAASAREADIVARRVAPAFTSEHYGDPGYAQLASGTDTGIRRGAEDGAEMGAFASLEQPQREDNLRARLSEYLPFGLEPGLLLVT